MKINISEHLKGVLLQMAIGVMLIVITVVLGTFWPTFDGSLDLTGLPDDIPVWKVYLVKYAFAFMDGVLYMFYGLILLLVLLGVIAYLSKNIKITK